MIEKDKINDLISRYLSGECSSAEEKVLLDWSNTTSENFAYFQEMKYTWITSVLLRNEPLFETEQALIDIHAELTVPSPEVKSPRFLSLVSYSILKDAFKYAAIFALIFIAGVISTIFFLGNKQKSQDLTMNYYEVPMGSKGVVVLPDGTKVWLNAGSKFKYSANYNKQNRVVVLEGEGFFDVVSNPKKPFVVTANGLQIKAFGTKFNVKAYNDEKKVVTTLIKGTVFIEGRDEQNKNFYFEMKPNQSVIYFTDSKNNPSICNKKPSPTEVDAKTLSEEKILQVITDNPIKTELITSWKDNRWTVDNMALQDFIKELERRYNVIFSISSSEINKFHFSGTIQNESIEQVLGILRLTLPIQYTINKNHIDLKVDPYLNSRYLKVL